jgi:hypothetical protein
MKGHVHRTAATELRDYVASYESDTFSASSSKLTRAEASVVVARLIDSMTAEVDGIRLANILASVRDNARRAAKRGAK